MNNLLMKKSEPLKRLCLVVLLMFFLISCAAPLTPDQLRIQRVTENYQQVLRERIATADEKIQVADKLLPIISEYDDILVNRRYVSYSAADAIRELKSDATELAAALYFEAAQQYKQAGQKEKAKQVYKDIIRIFIGSAYSGYRDRARMEIDDLRSE